MVSLLDVSVRDKLVSTVSISSLSDAVREAVENAIDAHAARVTITIDAARCGARERQREKKNC